MREKFLLNGLILTAALGLAYYASVPAGKNETGTQDWITIDESTLAEIKYLAPDRSVSAKPMAQGQVGSWWIQFKSTAKAQTADAKSPTETIDEGFKADDSLKELLKSFQPLNAIRVLGDSEKLDLKEFGMADQPDRLVFVTKDAKNIEFVLGKKSYGSANQFMLDSSRKKVILAQGAYIENLKNATGRMQERRLSTLRVDEVKKLLIQRNDSKWQWDHTKKDSKGNLTWRDDSEGAEAKPSYATWQDKLLRLRVLRYAKEDEINTIKRTQPILSLEYNDGTKAIETLFVYKTSPADSPAQYWLKTGFLNSYVDVGSPKIEALLKDLTEILGK